MKKFLTILLIFCLGLSATMALAEEGFDGVPIPNPLGEQDIWGVINRALNFLFIMCMYGGLIFIIWAGWTYITSQGDTGKTKKAMQMIQSVLIGITIVLLARAIIGFTYYIVTGNRGGLPNLNSTKSAVDVDDPSYVAPSGTPEPKGIFDRP